MSVAQSVLAECPLNRLLKLAVMAGVESSVRVHISRGDDLDARDPTGKTPLMLAALRDRAAICVLLLNAGADPSLRDSDGADALAIARASGATEALASIKSWCAASGRYGQTESDTATVVEVARPSDAIDVHPTVVSSPAGRPGYEAEPIPLLDKAGQVDSLVFEVEQDDTIGSDQVADFEIDGLIDLGDWAADEEVMPSEPDVTSIESATAVHKAITRHVPVDTWADWADFEAFLPDRAVAVRSDSTVEDRMALRQLLLRALREGSVPVFLVEETWHGQATHENETSDSSLLQVINDLGAETDERVEYSGPFESFAVDVDPVESSDEEEEIDAAMTFLDDLVAHRNDPMRIFMREAYRQRMISAEEEVDLAKAMEVALQEAVRALASWSHGLQKVLHAGRRVIADAVRLSSFTTPSRDEGINPDQVMAEDGDDSHALGVIKAEAIYSAGDDNDGAGADTEDLPTLTADDDLARVRAALSELEGMAEAAVAERIPSARIHGALESMQLARGFLVSLVDEARRDRSPAATSYRGAVERYLTARNLFVVANLRLVFSIAKRYMGSGLLMDDLLQEGHVGLIKAVDKFDWRRGYKFSTMGTWWVRQQVTRAIGDTCRTIRLPVHVHEVVQHLFGETRRFESKLGRSPTNEELAEKFGVKLSKVKALLAAAATPISLDELDPGEPADASGLSNPINAVSATQLRRGLDQMLASLDARSAKIMRLRFGLDGIDPRTLEEIGDLYDLTRERIRQVEAKALRRLRRPTRAVIQTSCVPNAADQGAHVPDGHADTAPAATFTLRAAVITPRMVQTEPVYTAVDTRTSSNEPMGVVHEDGGEVAMVLEKVLAAGGTVDDQRGSKTGVIWIRIPASSDFDHAVLGRRLLHLGFREWPGHGYWK